MIGSGVQALLTVAFVSVTMSGLKADGQENSFWEQQVLGREERGSAV